MRGAIPQPESDTPADVRVVRADLPNEIPVGSIRGPNWGGEPDRFMLRVPEVVRFLITEGRQIEVTVEPGVEDGDAAPFLIGSAFGVLHHQRRRMVLHASAVAVGDKAVLFCGPSGAGKSTLAAALNQKGYACISDDVCCIDFSSGAPIALPDGRMLKLWSDAVDHLEMSDRQGAAIRSHLAKYFVEPESTALDRDVAVAAVYFLWEANTPAETGIERLSNADAAVMLRRNAYRPRLLGRIGLESDYFVWSSTLQRQSGIFRLSRVRDLSAMPQVIENLQTHWRTLGLLRVAA
jgi:hypothetical protein